MRAIALPWLDERLGHRPPDPARAAAVLEAPPFTPGEALRSPVDHGAASLLDLALRTGGPQLWEPHPFAGWEATWTCEGDGRPVLTLGADQADTAAITAAGARACAVSVHVPDGAEGAAVARGQALVDGAAGAILQAASALGNPDGAVVVGVYAVGAWAPTAAATGLPCVLRAPARDPRALDPSLDPPWVHVPGGWWGGLDALYARALAVGDDRGSLVAALLASAALRSHPLPSNASPTAPSSDPNPSPGGT
jgi:hypothetical protein